MKREEFKRLFKAMLTCSVTFIVVMTCVAVMCTAIIECVSAYRLGEASVNEEGDASLMEIRGSGYALTYNNSGDPEAEYVNFVFNDKAVSFVGRYVAWVGFFVFKLSNTGWSARLAYRFTVSLIWLVVALAIMIWWLCKRLLAKAEVKAAKSRYGVSPVDYEGIKDRCLRLTVLDVLFMLAELVMVNFQIFIMSADYMMYPTLAVGIIFLLINIVWQMVYYFSERPDLECYQETRLKRIRKKFRR